MTKEELIEKISSAILHGEGVPNATLESNIPVGVQMEKLKKQAVGGLVDQWAAEVIGNDMEIITGTTATAPTRELPGNPGNEHMFAFEDGFNRRGVEARKRAGLPEK